MHRLPPNKNFTKPLLKTYLKELKLFSVTEFCSDFIFLGILALCFVILCSSALIEISAFEKIYQKYLTQLKGKESQDRGCPLCRRKFPNQREVKALIEEVAIFSDVIKNSHMRFIHSLFFPVFLVKFSASGVLEENSQFLTGGF